MDYLKYLNYEQILYLKRYKCFFEGMPKHCKDTNSIFIHIPKSAGMSIVNAIYGLDNSNHDTWREYYRRDKAKFNKYFKFSFVRHPLERFISAYNYLSNNGKSEIDRYWNEKYIKPFGNVENFILSGGLKKANRSVEHFKSQTSFLFNDNILMVDFVGKYESLYKDIDVIKSNLNIDFQLVKKNDSKNKILNENILSHEAKEIIFNLYKNDFLNFSYA